MTPKRILVIRRDNIGDLVCTTPLFSALRAHFPNTHIAALVNSYNASVLNGNADIDKVHVYRKAKHRAANESRFVIWWQTWQLMRSLRREKFDLAIVATPARQRESQKFARWVRAKRVIAYGLSSDGIDDPMPGPTPQSGHETELVMRLLQPLGIFQEPGPTSVAANATLADAVQVPDGQGLLVALHISARKPAQRWPVEYFSALINALHTHYAIRFLLFWSPGSEHHALHPGDDDKAEQLLSACQNLPLLPCPTKQLDDLVAGLSRCDLVICSDGGAMHIAAGLGKPIVCFFGNSDSERWHPWAVEYELLQPASRNVTDVSVDDAVLAVGRLLNKLKEVKPAQPKAALQPVR